MSYLDPVSNVADAIEFLKFFLLEFECPPFELVVDFAGEMETLELLLGILAGGGVCVCNLCEVDGDFMDEFVLGGN